MFLGQKLSRTDEALSPRAALVFLPTKTQTYYFSYGTSFNPSAEALVLALNNAGTEPEKNETFELGAKWDLLRRGARHPHRASSGPTRTMRAPPIRCWASR